MTYADNILNTIRDLKPELQNRYFVDSIGLFGSVVRDDFSPSTSDIDIIVAFSKPVGVEFLDLAEFLESKFQRKVDLVSAKGIKPKYFNQIQSEIVYA